MDFNGVLKPFGHYDRVEHALRHKINWLVQEHPWQLSQGMQV
jgi:hypothetical protein